MQYCLDVYWYWNIDAENYEKKMTRNAIEKTFQKKKEEQQRLKYDVCVNDLSKNVGGF